MARTLETESLELLPVLNLVMLLIPMLLASAQLTHFGAIPASMASKTVDATETAATNDTIDAATPPVLSVAADADGLTLRLDAAILAALPCAGACVGVEAWDYDGLNRAAAAVKATHPGARAVALHPTEEVPYEALVRMMDAVRGTEQAPLFPDVVFPVDG